MTRLQTERFENELESSKLEIETITSKLLAIAPQETIIMHPLPRTKEIAYEVDEDHRAAYFRQMQNSIPVRMAILSLILGGHESKSEGNTTDDRIVLNHNDSEPCSNLRCVLTHESYLKPKFFYRGDKVNDVRCLYCDQGVKPKGSNFFNLASSAKDKDQVKEGTN